MCIYYKQMSSIYNDRRGLASTNDTCPIWVDKDAYVSLTTKHRNSNIIFFIVFFFHHQYNDGLL